MDMAIIIHITQAHLIHITGTLQAFQIITGHMKIAGQIIDLGLFFLKQTPPTFLL